MKSHARCVVIGGGMMGVGLLYHLAEEGWTDSLLIEKDELTSGSTWHAAGLCPSFIADFNMAKIHDYGIKLYPRLEALTGQYVSWHGCGAIRFATKPAEVEWFQHVAGVAKLIGFRMEIIDPEKIRQINPFVTTDGVLAGAWTLDDGHVDPAGCCNALAQGARDLGAAIGRHNQVMDVNQRPRGQGEHRDPALARRARGGLPGLAQLRQKALTWLALLIQPLVAAVAVVADRGGGDQQFGRLARACQHLTQQPRAALPALQQHTLARLAPAALGDVRPGQMDDGVHVLQCRRLELAALGVPGDLGVASRLLAHEA